MSRGSLGLYRSGRPGLYKLRQPTPQPRLNIGKVGCTVPPCLSGPAARAYDLASSLPHSTCPTILTKALDGFLN